MPEGANVEIAHSLTEQDHEHGGNHLEGWHRVLEILEVALLALVAIVTAWSGFQAGKWDGRQSVLYGHSSRDRFEAEAATTVGDQRLAADAGIFTAWLQAHSAGNTELETLLAKRLNPDFKVAFTPGSGPTPSSMTRHRPDPRPCRSTRTPTSRTPPSSMPRQVRPSTKAPRRARPARSTVRDTVLFATVLFLVAIAQRMKDETLRAGVNVIAVILASYGIFSVVRLPRL